MEFARDRPFQLLELARSTANSIPDFQRVLGAGEGDRATNAFMKTLRARAVDVFGEDFSEKKICGQNSFAVDFYFAREKTLVEVALSLEKPQCEFEKDILKAIMAQELGNAVTRLLFICRPGGAKKCKQPGRAAIGEWAQRKHSLSTEVHDLDGEPRVRRRANLG